MLHCTTLLIALLAATDVFANFCDRGYDQVGVTSYPELSILDPPGSSTNEDAPPPPFPPRHPGKKSNGTIYTTLSENPEFSRLVKVVNISDDIVSLLNDSSVNLTFFAVPNYAIPKRPNHTDPSNLVQPVLRLEELVSTLEPVIDGGMYSRRAVDDRVKKLVTIVLSYHIIPQDLDLWSLTKNTTYSTQLSHLFGALHDEAIRLRFSAAFPFARVNFYSEVVKPDIGTTNGFIHVVNRPLAPPLTVFQSVFLLQQGFSTLSSAIQRTDLTSELDYKLIPDLDAGKTSSEGSPVVTVFAPTNRAFSDLPRDLQLFLFSPFGGRILKKILQYHIVPDIALYTDWILNSTSGDFSDRAGEKTVRSDDAFPASVWNSLLFGGQHPLGGDFDASLPEPDIVHNLTLATALEGHTLNVLVVKFPIRRPIPGHPGEIGSIKQVYVNGRGVAVYDGVASNGALHVVDKLVSPRRPKRKPHHGGVPAVDTGSSSPDVEEDNDDWEDWEDWLVEWAGN